MILGKNGGEDNIQIVVSARTAFVQGHALVLKKLQRLAVLSRHAVHSQSTGQLKHQDPHVASLRANLDGCCCVERVIGEDGGFQGVAHGAKGDASGREVGNAMRGPDIVKGSRRVFYCLTQQELLVALPVHNDIEWARGGAVKVGVKRRPRVR